MTAPKLYRKPNTDLRIYALEEHGDIRWTRLAEDHANIANLKRSTKYEFEVMRSNEGYEDKLIRCLP
jgi:hypothetical protein